MSDCLVFIVIQNYMFDSIFVTFACNHFFLKCTSYNYPFGKIISKEVIFRLTECVVHMWSTCNVYLP